MSGSPFGILEAKSSEKASEAQLQANQQAIAAQLAMYNQARADQLPSMLTGDQARNALWSAYTTPEGRTGAIGLVPGGPGEFKESEGYKWTLGQGLEAQRRQASATGRLGSGDYIKDATKYAEGLASTEYDNFLTRYYKSLDPYFRLAGLGSNVAMGAGNQAIQAGNALANTYTQGGNAAAAGILGQYGAYSNAMTNAGNQVGNYLMQNRPWGQNAGLTSNWGYTPAGASYWGGVGAAGGMAGLDAAAVNSMMWL